VSLLALYADRFRALKVNVQNGRASPQKICMVLALLDLARSGALETNRIEFGPTLLERYGRFFEAVKGLGDHANPYFPFFHLAGRLRGGGESFWHLKPLPGRDVALQAMVTARSSRNITENIECAELDADLFELLQDPANIEALSEAISRHWFDRGLEDLRAVVGESSRISEYEHVLRSGLPSQTNESPPPAYVRDPAFRRVVTQIYDYRCAASGVRIVLPTGEAMVQAAHIHPFSEAGDDDPRNGLALTPDMHWAMDANLIAPGPDYRWHVSTVVDDRIPDFSGLVQLRGKELFLPRERRCYPKREVLEWRLGHLRKPARRASDAPSS
jgi:putative restriction endonuclease